jgi:rare lipoprotein A (peptidoglycan hydrolase)
MTSSTAVRTLALGGVALIAAVVALAFGSSELGGSDGTKALPQPARTWYTALAAPYGPSGEAKARRTACNRLLSTKTLGVAHPVLPCGVKVYISFGGTRVLTEVIDRGPFAPGREFALTKALADRIGLHGTQPIRWTFAR